MADEPARGAPEGAAPTNVSWYHLHLYFAAESRASAAAIRECLARGQGFEVEVGRLHDAPVGPHLGPQFLARVPPSALEAALRWYLTNRGGHAVLLHPDTGRDQLDHTAYALWLGERQPLDYTKLDAE